MSKAMVKAYSILSVSFTGAILLAVLAGSLRTQPAALVRLDDCHLPCWNEITPEQTTNGRAADLLSRAGYETDVVNHHWRYATYRPSDNADCKAALTYDARVFLTELIECHGATLGDVMAILGPPQEVLPSVPFDTFIFRDRTVVVITRRPRCEAGFSLYAEITSIRLRARLEGSSETGKDFISNPLPWHGLIPVWGYDAQLPFQC